MLYFFPRSLTLACIPCIFFVFHYVFYRYCNDKIPDFTSLNNYITIVADTDSTGDTLRFLAEFNEVKRGIDMFFFKLSFENEKEMF